MEFSVEKNQSSSQWIREVMDGGVIGVKNTRLNVYKRQRKEKKKETATYHLCVILIPIKRAPFLHIHTLFLTHLVTCIIIIIIFYAPHCYIYFIYEWWNEMRVFIFYSNAFFYVIYYGNGSGLCILSQRWLICLFFLLPVWK